MLARAFATARSRLNFFQSLFVTDNVMSVTNVITPIAISATALH